MDKILFWVLLPYDALVAPFPYFWVKVALGIATGLFIPHRTIGLVACALGNVAVFAYAAFVSWHPGRTDILTKTLNSLWSDPSEFLLLSLFVFVGVVWWLVGRIMRWAFYKIRGHTHAHAS
jgi:hypothetical protein